MRATYESVFDFQQFLGSPLVESGIHIELGAQMDPNICTDQITTKSHLRRDQLDKAVFDASLPAASSKHMENFKLPIPSLHEEVEEVV